MYNANKIEEADTQTGVFKPRTNVPSSWETPPSNGSKTTGANTPNGLLASNGNVSQDGENVNNNSAENQKLSLKDEDEIEDEYIK